MKRILHGIKVAFEDYKAVRRISMVWAWWLITYTVLEFFDNLKDVTAPVATVITAIIGILTVVVGLYHRDRSENP